MSTSSSMTWPRLMVAVASTRPGRVGAPVARWFVDAAERHVGFDVGLVDLAQLDLPMMDEPNHPAMRQCSHQHTKDWSARAQLADAVVVVTPEYNHGYSAPLKNAFDYLSAEWAYKPVGFVSYGGVAAGTRAVQQFKQVASTLKMTPVFESVNLPFIHALIRDDETIPPDEGLDAAVTAMLDELVRVEAALRPLRDEVRRSWAPEPQPGGGDSLLATLGSP